MKNKLLKFLPILIGVCALADTQMELLKGIGLSNSAIDIIKVIGLIAALFLPGIPTLFAKEGDPAEPPIDDEGIPGGGIRNPKP